jgi:4a-hydroxytetrahydrobiopterin dehydratase
MDELKQLNCVPPRRGGAPLAETDAAAFKSQVPEWQVIEVDGVKRLQRQFKFKNFSEALSFTNKIGALAEEEDHHPALLTEWGMVTVTWWTHAVQGLHKNDFIMAAKVDALVGADAT